VVGKFWENSLYQEKYPPAKDILYKKIYEELVNTS
jgi:hypothetical protein